MKASAISRDARRPAKLRDFLEWHREQWTAARDPLTAALTLKPRGPGGKRLTLEELAELAGYAPPTIYLFNAGGVRTPNPAFLDAVADALRLSLVDRDHLWRLAGVSPPTVADCRRMLADNPPLAQEVQENHPRPSYLMDPAFRLLAYNDAVPVWLWDPRQHPELEDNLALWTFLHPHARHVYPYWADGVTPAMMARIRAVHAKLPGNQHISDLITRLCDESDWAKRLWEEETAVVEWPTACVLRIPGHTDPDQPGDLEHQVKARVATLSSTAEGDERLLVTISVPPQLRHLAPEISQQPCLACARTSVAEAGAAVAG